MEGVLCTNSRLNYVPRSCSRFECPCPRMRIILSTPPPSLPKSPPRAQRTTALGRRYSPAAPMNNGCSPAAPMVNGVTHAVARARRPGATALATPVLTRPLSRPFPPPNDSVSRAAVRPQPLAVTQGEPIQEDEEHEKDPWRGRGCTTARLTMMEPNWMFAVRILR